MVNLNKLARKITLKEGKKKSISIAQVKEVMKLMLIEIGKLTPEEAGKLIIRYRK